jgi:2-polyprenyl-3-methyl-5-hydroxy-6-metoxy-1,4-benzoquinol methylase
LKQHYLPMPGKFKYRSSKAEMMDAPFIRKELLFQNLHELDLLNRTLGGHAITISGIKKLVTDKNKTYHIVDLGCGSGDSLKSIAIWARSHDFKVRLTGIDINGDAINYLDNHCRDYPEISGKVSDWQEYLKDNNTIDIIHCSLFCHHLHDEELGNLFSMIRHQVKTGFVINDLRRSRFAYYSVIVFTRLLNGSVLSKNDGPISVLRGFKSYEIISMMKQAQIKHYTIQRKWAFRFLIVGKTNN